MKKISLSIFLLIAIAWQIQAGQISEKEAMLKAQSFTTSAIGLKSQTERPVLNLVHEYKEADETYYYVFNKGEHNGYVIVSGSDNTESIIGYSDNGTFDANNLPENMRWWLSTYVDQIKSVSNAYSVVEPKETTSNDFVEPLLGEIKWNQDSPYNDECPLLNSAGQRAATGCVATAFSQVMYYHKYPEKGVGTKTYTKGSFTLTANFGAETYNWAAMTPTYDNNSSEESRAAVARLMSHVGIASEMNYGTSSGAVTTTALGGLVNYFSYDKGARYLLRDYHSLSDWVKILKDELKAARPIIYGGNSSEGGHQFVCDGYDQNGMFHINWGWGGSSDGYFKITILTPYEQGIGGSTGGFNYSQDAVIGIQKPVEGGTTSCGNMYAKSFVTSTTTATKGSSVRFSFTDIYNYSYGNFEGAIALGFYNEAGELVAVSGNTAINLKPRYGYYTLSLYCDIPASLTDGTYKMKPVQKGTTEQNWRELGLIISATRYTASISGNNVTISSIKYAPELKAENIVIGKAFKDVNFDVTADITNSGTEYYSSFNVVVYDSNGTQIYKGEGVKDDIETGATVKVSFTEKLSVAPGTYLLAIVNDGGTVISEKVSFELNAAPAAPIFSVVSMTFADNDNVPMGNMELSVEMDNTGGYYNNTLYFYIFKATGTTSLASIKTTTPIDANVTTKFTVSGSTTLGEGDYKIISYYKNSTYLSQIKKGNYLLKFHGVAGSSVEKIENDASTVTIYPNPTSDYATIKTEGNVESVKLYNISGVLVKDNGADTKIDLSTLPTGNYITLIMVDGKVTSDILVKK
ncbi:MAG: thiol protease/hemagglutinin PrtT [Muribaculaceae bacterium]|nr:thiol protease/hemagglutinin PrtT [Muribaculaceae bacterium]